MLAGLRERDPDNATIVVFWSDHGFHLGEHGLISKTVPFREVLEAPLCLRAPGFEPGARRSLVQMLDVFPTLCELAKVPEPAGLDGRSLVPALSREERIREATYSEFIGLWGAIRTPAWKLVLGHRSATGFDQLYDLVNDPGETRNCFADAARGPVVEELVSRMEALLRASPPDWVDAGTWLGDRSGIEAVRWVLGQIETM